MKLQVIKPRFGYMAVSEDPIFPGIHWWIHPETEHLGFAEEPLKAPYLKIIATDTSFKMEGIPQFELEDNIPYLQTTDKDQQWAYKEGYRAAKSKGCFTEEDMKSFSKFVTSNLMKHSDKNGGYLGIDKVFNMWNQPKKLVTIEIDDMEASQWISNEKGHGRVNIKLPIITKSEQYPDGLLTIKQYFYE
jgi:hypothetical protein